MRIAVIGDSPRDEALRTQLRRMGNEVSDSEADADVVVALSSDATTAPGRTPVVVRGDVNVPSFPPGVEAQAWAVLRACEDAVEARPVKRDAPRVGLWGTFDVENFGDLLFPRIFELELRRRIPNADIRFFSPLGTRVALDPSLETEPLGSWSYERAAELGAELDLVVVGGGEIVHTHDEYYERWYGDGGALLRPSEYFVGGLGSKLERCCPVAWHAVGVPFELDGYARELVRSALPGRRYVSVRDEISRERLRQVVPDREIVLVPDSAFLLERLFSRDELEERRRRLRDKGEFPREARPLVLQGSVALLPFAASIADAAAGIDCGVVLLSTGPCHGDDEFAAALAERLPNAYRLGSDATLVDIAAAIAGASGFVGISLHGTITALVYDVPVVVVNPVGYTKLDGLAEVVGIPESVIHAVEELPEALRRLDRSAPPQIAPLVQRVDAHFDALAEIARESVASRNGTAAIGARLAHLALRTADERHELERQALDLERHELDAVRAEQDALQRELHALRETRLFRYSEALQGAYDRLRGAAERLGQRVR